MGCFCMSSSAVLDDPPATAQSRPSGQECRTTPVPAKQQQEEQAAACPPCTDATVTHEAAGFAPNSAVGIPAAAQPMPMAGADAVALSYEQQQMAQQRAELAALQKAAREALESAVMQQQQQQLLQQFQQPFPVMPQYVQQHPVVPVMPQQQQQPVPQLGRSPMDFSSDPLLGQTRWKRVKDIGAGTYGFVVAAHDVETGENVAIKFLERGKTLGKMVEREILSHRLCSAHPHIVQFKELFLTPRYLAIVMEYASGGDLFEYTLRSDGHLSEDEARALFQQLVSAVAFCHRVGVVNRDIKLENALLSPSADESPLLKLCDFGYSKNEHVDSACKTAAGTPEYVAPEMVLTQGNYDGKAADVWSCGIFLYVTLNGAYPFHTEPGDKLAIKRMVKGMFKFHVEVSPACEDLMRRMLVANPAERISIEEVMRHPWYTHKLPDPIAQLNKRPPKSVASRQGEDEIRRVVAEASQVDALALGAFARYRRP